MDRFAAIIVAGLACNTLAISQDQAASTQPSASPPAERDRVVKMCGKTNPPPCAQTPPRAIDSPPPQYSEQARKEKYQGNVVLELIVGLDGTPRDVKVQRSLGLGLDEEAVKAVRKWRFEPATMDGNPVSVRVNIMVGFKLQ